MSDYYVYSWFNVVLGENDKILLRKEYASVGAKYKGKEVTAERSTQLNSKEKYRWRDV